jgi:hypothetical protein
MNNKFIRIGLGVFIGAAVIGSSYLVFRRIVKDRAAAMSYREHPARSVATPTSPVRTVQTYTAQDLEAARKNGKNLPAEQNPAAQPVATNDAVQRNLQTLDEINRINQMNQRLMEQQERVRRQMKN